MKLTSGFVLSLALFLPAMAIEIQVPLKQAVYEKGPAEELQFHLQKITGEEVKIRPEGKPESYPVFYVGMTKKAEKAGIITKKMDREQWAYQSCPEGLILNGGFPRGALYAVYHYLEDLCGVRWWQPNADPFIPAIKTADLPLKNIKRTGKPAFAYRTLTMRNRYNPRHHMRLRLTPDNGSIYPAIVPEYGGMDNMFGRPNSCHTFAWYIPQKKYFKTNPEWFAFFEGKRSPRQLCLSNKELRKVFVSKLREYIKQDEKDFKAGKFTILPTVYDISQNDYGDWCYCDNCNAIKKREGADSGLLLDFINEIATTIKKEYPHVIISTFAYLQTEEVPKHIKPADNVMIVLCDTASNMGEAITHPINKRFYDQLKNWGRISKHLRIWEYYSLLMDCIGLPIPNEFFMAEDLKMFRKYGATALFLEHDGNGLTGDAGDYKLWLLAHLAEDPDQDFEKLTKEFAHGYYGKAGDTFIRYRKTLRKLFFGSLGMTTHANHIVYLNLKNCQTLYKILDEGAELVKDDKILFRRWEHLRMGIDRAILLRNVELRKEYQQLHNTQEGYPFDTAMIRKRVKRVWCYELYRRWPNVRNWIKWEHETMNKEEKLYDRPVRFHVPQKFKNVPSADLFIFEPETFFNKHTCPLIKDPESDIGLTVKRVYAKTTKKLLPLDCGVYDWSEKQNLLNFKFQKEHVKGRGYHWYKLGECRMGRSSGLYFNWSITCRALGSAFQELNPQQKFEVWVSAKFSGPAFFDEDKGQDNATYVNRMVLVSKK